MKKVTKNEDNKTEIIDVGFENETLNSCLDQVEIVEKLQNREEREKVEKSLNQKDKLFIH